MNNSSKNAESLYLADFSILKSHPHLSTLIFVITYSFIARLQ